MDIKWTLNGVATLNKRTYHFVVQDFRFGIAYRFDLAS
jgi:hypothetical protein